MGATPHSHGLAPSQNDVLEQARGPLELYMQPHLASLPASTAVAMIQSCKFFKQLLDTAPASCFRQLARITPNIISAQADTGAELLLMLRQQGRIQRSMQSPEGRCIQQLEVPPEIETGYRNEWWQLCAWPNTNLAGLSVLNPQRAFDNIHVFDIKTTQAPSVQLLTSKAYGPIQSLYRANCLTTDNHSFVILGKDMKKHGNHLICVQPNSSSDVNTIEIHGSLDNALSAEQNAYVALLEPQTIAASMIDIPSLQQRFMFEQLPPDLARMDLFLRCVAWSPDGAKVAFVWSARVPIANIGMSADEFGNKQRDEVLAIHASTDGRLLTLFKLANLYSTDIFAPTVWQDANDDQYDIWFSNCYAWSPDSARISAFTLRSLVIFGMDGSKCKLPPLPIFSVDSEDIKRVLAMGCEWSPAGNFLRLDCRDHDGSHCLIWDVAGEAIAFQWTKDFEDDDASSNLSDPNDSFRMLPSWLFDNECLIPDCDAVAVLISQASQETTMCTLSPLNLHFMPEDLQERFTYHLSANAADGSCIVVGCPTQNLALPEEDKMAMMSYFDIGTNEAFLRGPDQVFVLWHALVSTDTPSCKVIKTFKQPCPCLAWHPSPGLKRFYAISSYARDVLLVDAEQHKILQEWSWPDERDLLRGNSYDLRVEWSLDGSCLLVHSPCSTRIIHFLHPGSGRLLVT